MWRWAVVAFAVAAALVPVPTMVVERHYSSALYPLWQSWMTRVSNLVPVALLDILIVALVLGWLVMVYVEWTRREGQGPIGRLGRILSRSAVWAAVLYLLFLSSWGLNYRRPRLTEKLPFDSSRVTAAAVRTLADTAVARLNTLYAPAHQKGWQEDNRVDAALESAFARAQRDLGDVRLAEPGRPKRTILNPYFRRAVVDGMTDPFFLETLVASDLLPFERPFVVAHEWAHLAGYNDEGEANFVGWLACLHADEPRQYSAWLAVYSEASAMLGRRDRQMLVDRLTSGARGDLRAIAERVARNRSARVSDAGWRVYNQYLKANRVEAGAASYTEVIQLILGTRFNPNQ